MRTRVWVVALMTLAACGGGETPRSTPLPCLGATTQHNAGCAIQTALVFLERTQVLEDRRGDTVALRGEWPSFVRGPLFRARGLDAFRDSNAFVVLGVMHALGLLEDSALPDGAARVTVMNGLAADLLAAHYADARGELNFWPTLDGFHGPQQLAAQHPWVDALGAPLHIPNDADDTALFHALPERLRRNHAAVDPAPLFAAWRDVERSRPDGRESWKEHNSGAFLTWLSDENRPGNRQPASPLLPNNVDCVVQANVLWSLGVRGALQAPGASEACALVRSALLSRAYPGCAHYYPSSWMLPYTAARARVEGGATCLDEPAAGATWDVTAQALLATQDAQGAWDDNAPFANEATDQDPRHAGFGGDARAFSTALNVNTLLLLRDHAQVAALRSRLEESAGRGLDWLWRHASEQDGQVFWQGGVYFSASFPWLALWKSRPLTTALVLEANARMLGARHGMPLRLDAQQVPPAWMVTP